MSQKCVAQLSGRGFALFIVFHPSPLVTCNRFKLNGLKVPRKKYNFFCLALYDTKNVPNTLNFVSCMWFVHILTVYLYASYETSTSYKFLYCQSLWPRPQTDIYFFTRKRFTVKYRHCMSDRFGM